MAVMIRLQRQGTKNRPQYAVVAINKADKRDGAYLEKLGQYFPQAKESKDKIKIDIAAVQRWQKHGAVCSETVQQLLKSVAN